MSENLKWKQMCESSSYNWKNELKTICHGETSLTGDGHHGEVISSTRTHYWMQHFKDCYLQFDIVLPLFYLIHSSSILSSSSALTYTTLPAASFGPIWTRLKERTSTLETGTPPTSPEPINLSVLSAFLGSDTTRSSSSPRPHLKKTTTHVRLTIWQPGKMRT